MSRFHACLRDDDPCSLRPVPGADDLLDAAIQFLERHGPDTDSSVSVIVEDRDTGARQCFAIDLEDGSARPC